MRPGTAVQGQLSALEVPAGEAQGPALLAMQAQQGMHVLPAAPSAQTLKPPPPPPPPAVALSALNILPSKRGSTNCGAQPSSCCTTALPAHEPYRPGYIPQRCRVLASGVPAMRVSDASDRWWPALLAQEADDEEDRKAGKRKRPGQEDGPDATQLLRDERFKAMFEDEAFAVDEKSEEYLALHPNARKENFGKKLLQEHFQEVRGRGGRVGTKWSGWGPQGGWPRGRKEAAAGGFPGCEGWAGVGMGLDGRGGGGGQSGGKGALRSLSCCVMDGLKDFCTLAAPVIFQVRQFRAWRLEVWGAL